MGEGDGKSRRRGDAQSPSSGFPRHIHPTFVAEGRCSRRAPRGYRTTSGRRVRRCRACAGFSAPISCSASCPSAAWVVRGARGTARRDLRVCPSLPPRTCHETGARRSDRRNGPRPNVSVRFESATARAHKRDRQTSALKTISLRYVPTRSIAHLGIGLHTSANVGRLASRAAGDPGGRRSDSSPTAVPFSTPPSLTGVRPSTVSLRPTSLMRSLIVALTLRSRFPLTIARSSGHLNGRVFAPDPRIPPTHSRQNECPHGSVTGELDSPSLQKSLRHTAHRRSSRSLRRMRCRGVPAGVPALLS